MDLGKKDSILATNSVLIAFSIRKDKRKRTWLWKLATLIWLRRVSKCKHTQTNPITFIIVIIVWLRGIKSLVVQALLWQNKRFLLSVWRPVGAWHVVSAPSVSKPWGWCRAKCVLFRRLEIQTSRRWRFSSPSGSHSESSVVEASKWTKRN